MSEVVECVDRSDVVMDGVWTRDLSVGEGPVVVSEATASGGDTDQSLPGGPLVLQVSGD